MKNKNDDKLITESILDSRLEKQTEVLRGIFKEYKDDMLINVSLMIEKAKIEIDDNAQKYRDQILTRDVKTSAELEQIRENQDFIKHDITNLQEKVGKLESAKVL